MKNSTAKILIGFGLIIVLGLIYFIVTSEKPIVVNSFEECVAQGHNIMESHPRQCVTPQGKVFFELLDDEFCGRSTNGYCESDSDCVKDGCSGQICRSVDESPTVTTCEWRECYNDETFGVNCGCVNNECVWS